MARARETWWTDPDGVGGVAPERPVFLDECGVLTTMARLHGRGPRGTRAPGSAPFGHWTRVTVLGALGAAGTVGAMGVEAALLRLVGGANRLTLAEIAARLSEAEGVRVHPATVHRALRRAGWT